MVKLIFPVNLKVGTKAYFKVTYLKPALCDVCFSGSHIWAGPVGIYFRSRLIMTGFTLTLSWRRPLSYSRNILGAFYIVTAGNYIFKVSNRNTRTKCEICLKLIKTTERGQHISRLVLVFLLLTFSR